MIGHAMPAAGIAGFIKTAMAVYDGVLPPSLHCDEPNEKLSATRFTVHGKAQPWANHKRIAGVNAFGFGGINTHAVLTNFGRSEHIGFSVIDNKPALPDLLLLAADSIDALLHKLDDAIHHSVINSIPANARYKLAIVQPNEKRFDLAKKVIAKNKPWRGRNQIYFSGDGLLSSGGKLALLFPGVDSSFEPRVDDVAAYFGLPLHECCKSMPMDDLGLVGMGIIQTNRLLHRALQQLGVHGDAVAGHSIGEWSAKVATECWPEADLEDVMREMKPGSLALPDVVFLAAGCGLEIANRAIDGLTDIELSHDNCPHQVIFCGSNHSIAIVEERLKDAQVMAQRLPFVSGFHSQLFKDFLPEYRRYFDRFPFAGPKIPLWSATTCLPVPQASAERRELAAQHLIKPVRFRELTEALYADGCRVFLQIGTGSLTGFVDDTLKGRDAVAISANVMQKSGLEQLCNVASALWVEGLAICWEKLGLQAAAVQSVNPAQKKNTSQIQLQLGVPFIHANQSMDAGVFSTTPKIQPVQIAANSALDISALAASNDPLQQMLALTLNDMQQASNDVIHAWRHSQQNLSVEKTQAINQSTRVTGINDGLPVASKTVLKRHLDLNSNIPYVIDHAFYAQKPGWPDLRDIKPVVPLTMIVLMLREAVEEVVPGIVVTAVEKVQAYNWMDVASPIDIELHVEPVEAGRAKVTIPGYCFGEVVYATTRPAPPVAGAFLIENEKTPEYTPEFVYGDKVMFHGPAYQGIKSLDKIGTRSIQGTLKNPLGKGALLDNMAQVFGCLLVETEPKDAMAMPIGVDRVNFYQADPEVGAELETRATITLMNSEAINADLFLVDKHGALIFSVEGWNNRRFPMDKKFWSDTRMAHRRQACSEIANGKAVLFVDEYERVITRDYIVGRYLNQPEKSVYDKTPPRKKRSWLNGRVAAKDAVKQFLWSRELANKQEKTDIWPKELRIENLDSGRPVVSAHINQIFSQELFVSIAHKDNLAVAMCSDSPVGIDIEKIAQRDDSFIDMAFVAEEIALINSANDRNECIALLWAAKEAIAKQCGTGLQGRPKSFVINAADFQNLEANGVRLQWQRYQDYIVCWTL
jgi:phosphopantetheine--protein transferase-like protein